MKEKMQPVAGSATESLRTPFTALFLLSESLEQAKKNAASIFSLKKIHPQGTRDSAEGIRINYRWARVKKADGKIPWAFNLAQAAAGAFDFATFILYRYFSGK